MAVTTTTQGLPPKTTTRQGLPRKTMSWRTNLVYVPLFISSQKIFISLKRLQIENSHLSAEVRALRGAGAGSTASSTTSAARPEKDLVKAYHANLGKRFAALSKLWVKESLLGRPYPQRFESLGPWDPKRCLTKAAWEEGTVAELYFFLPESCHELIAGSTAFSKSVRGHHLSFFNLGSHRIKVFKGCQGISRISHQQCSRRSPCNFFNRFNDQRAVFCRL